MLAALLYKVIRHLSIYSLSLFYSLQPYIAFTKSTSIIRKIKPKSRLLHVAVIEYTIIHNIAYNIAYAISAPSSLIIYIVKETLFKIINFNIIKKTPSLYNRFYNFQNIKKRRSLIREIINKIAVFKNYFKY